MTPHKISRPHFTSRELNKEDEQLPNCLEGMFLLTICSSGPTCEGMGLGTTTSPLRRQTHSPSRGFHDELFLSRTWEPPPTSKPSLPTIKNDILKVSLPGAEPRELPQLLRGCSRERRRGASRPSTCRPRSLLLTCSPTPAFLTALLLLPFLLPLPLLSSAFLTFTHFLFNEKN